MAGTEGQSLSRARYLFDLVEADAFAEPRRNRFHRIQAGLYYRAELHIVQNNGLGQPADSVEEYFYNGRTLEENFGRRIVHNLLAEHSTGRYDGVDVYGVIQIVRDLLQNPQIVSGERLPRQKYCAVGSVFLGVGHCLGRLRLALWRLLHRWCRALGALVGRHAIARNRAFLGRLSMRRP